MLKIRENLERSASRQRRGTGFGGDDYISHHRKSQYESTGGGDRRRMTTYESERGQRDKDKTSRSPFRESAIGTNAPYRHSRVVC